MRKKLKTPGKIPTVNYKTVYFFEIQDYIFFGTDNRNALFKIMPSGITMIINQIPC